jgi:hypothetical protein
MFSNLPLAHRTGLLLSYLGVTPRMSGTIIADTKK